MTGVQALEWAAPTLPMRPGRAERREFEYIRHGTLTLIASFDIATGQVTYCLGPTRTEADFARWLVELLASHDAATHWHLIMDNLNIHVAEAIPAATTGSRRPRRKYRFRSQWRLSEVEQSTKRLPRHELEVILDGSAPSERSDR